MHLTPDNNNQTETDSLSNKGQNLDLYKSLSTARKYKITPLSQAEKTQTSELVYRLCSVIHPHSKIKKIWDLILIFLLLYIAIFMPYRIAFIDGVLYDEWWWLDNIVNLLFFCDLIINCCSAYTDELGNLIYSHKKIFINYLKGWMIIDLISCIPFDVLLENSNGDSVKYNSLLRLFRLPRLYRLVRISKIFKLMQQYKNSEFMQKIQDFFNIKQSLARLIGVFFTVLICLHIFACFWAFVPKVENFEPNTWVVKANLLDEFHYILAIYWCMVTFSTVGYGEITPGTNFEIILAIFWMLFGICFYSFIIGSLASILSNLETK